jgi:hypothetical protein
VVVIVDAVAFSFTYKATILDIRIEAFVNIDSSLLMELLLTISIMFTPDKKYVLIPIFFESPRIQWTSYMQYILQNMKIGIFYECYYLFMYNSCHDSGFP